MSILKPNESVIVGATTATLVYGIYQAALPPIADVRVADNDNPDIQASERLAAWTAAAAVSGISLLTRDATVFVLGGLMVITLSWWHRHADQVSPLTGKATGIVSGPFTQEEDLPVDSGEPIPLFAS